MVKSLWSIVCAVLPGFLLLDCSHPETKVVPRKYTIEIKEMRFQPDDLQVHVGDTVEWINKDLVAHDITEEVNKEWSSGPLNAGKSWDLVVTKSANYFCSIHVVMKGKLEVP